LIDYELLFFSPFFWFVVVFLYVAFSTHPRVCCIHRFLSLIYFSAFLPSCRGRLLVELVIHRETSPFRCGAGVQQAAISPPKSHALSASSPSVNISEKLSHQNLFMQKKRFFYALLSYQWMRSRGSLCIFVIKIEKAHRSKDESAMKQRNGEKC